MEEKFLLLTSKEWPLIYYRKIMANYKTEYRKIDFSKESCPPEWCPINKITPHSEGCCHGCGYFGDEDFFKKVFCMHPDANVVIPQNTE